LLRLYSVSGKRVSKNGALAEWYWQGKTEIPEEKSVQAPVCPQDILNRLAWHWTRNYKQESAPWSYSVEYVIIL